MFRKRYKIFRWTAPLWSLILAAVLVMSVAAWAVYGILTATQAVALDVKDASEVPLVAIAAEDCSISAGTATASVSLVGADLSCSVSNFDDEAEGMAYYEVENLDPTRSIQWTRTIPADDPCVTFTTNTPPAILAPSDVAAFRLSFAGVAGPAGTITCASTSIGPFVSSLDFEFVP